MPLEVIQAKGKDLDQNSLCPKSYPRFLYPMGDGLGGYLMQEQYVVPGEQEEGGGALALQPLLRTGYVSIFPLLLRLVDAQNNDGSVNPKLETLLDLVSPPSDSEKKEETSGNRFTLWSDFGLKSMAQEDMFYRRLVVDLQRTIAHLNVLM